MISNLLKGIWQQPFADHWTRRESLEMIFKLVFIKTKLAPSDVEEYLHRRARGMLCRRSQERYSLRRTFSGPEFDLKCFQNAGAHMMICLKGYFLNYVSVALLVFEFKFDLIRSDGNCGIQYSIGGSGQVIRKRSCSQDLVQIHRAIRWFKDFRISSNSGVNSLTLGYVGPIT